MQTKQLKVKHVEGFNGNGQRESDNEADTYLGSED